MPRIVLGAVGDTQGKKSTDSPRSSEETSGGVNVNAKWVWYSLPKGLRTLRGGGEQTAALLQGSEWPFKLWSPEDGIRDKELKE